MTTKLYPFQLEAARFLEDHEGRALLGHDMGLGKSLIALTFAKWNRTARPIIVVCPAGIKFNWQAEALKHLGMRSEILSGRKRIRRRLHTIANYQLLIINYDILAAWVKYLKRLKPQLVIIDEAHRTKHPQTMTSKAIRELVAKVPHVIALSGTPIENNASEFWNILNILRPGDKRFKSRIKFCLKHSYARRKWYGWTFSGCKDPQRLNKVLKDVMTRKRKQDVLTELPPKTRSVVVLGMEHSGKEYQRAVHDFRHWLEESLPQRARKYSRNRWKAEQFVKLGYLKRLAAKLKLAAVFDWLDDYQEETDNKLLVAAIHKESIIYPLHARYGGVLVTGNVTGLKRKQAIAQFNDDPKCQFMFGQLKAASEGWNGKHWTTLTVEYDWKPTTHLQLEDRCVGINRGSGMPSMHYYAVAKGSIETDLVEYLQKKQDMIDGVLDGKFRKEERELDIFDQLTQILNHGKPF